MASFDAGAGGSPTKPSVGPLRLGEDVLRSAEDETLLAPKHLRTSTAMNPEADHNQSFDLARASVDLPFHKT
jgi:hypothetical protein